MGRNQTTWRKGEGGNPKGRPPRDYSISHAINIAKKALVTTDDEGNPMTAEQAAARWLVGCMANGIDLRNLKETALSFKDRLEAMKTVLRCVEPDYKLGDKQVDEFEGEEVREFVEKIKALAPDQIAALAAIGVEPTG